MAEKTNGISAFANIPYIKMYFLLNFLDEAVIAKIFIGDFSP